MRWFPPRRGRRTGRPDAVGRPPVPTPEELAAALEAIRERIAGRVPPSVQARVERIVTTVHRTLPRLDELGPGSQQAHAVMATVTSYLPDALDAYLRLPRSFADRRPVSAGRTALVLLCEQLDLLAQVTDELFEATCRSDVRALQAHGRFLAEKFGRDPG